MNPKFKAWSHEDKKMYQVVGLTYNDKGNLKDVLVKTGSKGVTKVLDPKKIELLMTTMNTDVDGKEVYLGDLLSFTIQWTDRFGKQQSKDYVRDVTYNSGNFKLNSFPYWPEKVKLVGNVFENPEIKNQ